MTAISCDIFNQKSNDDDDNDDGSPNDDDGDNCPPGYPNDCGNGTCCDSAHPNCCPGVCCALNYYCDGYGGCAHGGGSDDDNDDDADYHPDLYWPSQPWHFTYSEPLYCYDSINFTYLKYCNQGDADAGSFAVAVWFEDTGGTDYESKEITSDPLDAGMCWTYTDLVATVPPMPNN